MPLRIALIGTSHAAAFKSAWDAGHEAWPGVTLTFFAARNGGPGHIGLLTPRDGKLVAGHPHLAQSLRVTSGGDDRVDPADFDAILLVGFGPRPPLLPPLSPYSEAVREEIYAASRRTSPLATMLKKIRAIAPEVPVFAAAPPLAAVPPGWAKPKAERYQAAFETMSREVGIPLGIRLLPQPYRTILADRWTDPGYTRGSLRLRIDPKAPKAEPHPDDDRTHMNAAYGKLALAEALAAVRSHHAKA